MTRKNQNFYKKEPALATNEDRFLKIRQFQRKILPTH
nr:MAG TPA: hypothetical protein [Caudoviricetes sp.]